MKKEIVIPIVAGVFGALFGSGAIFQFINYKQEKQKIELEFFKFEVDKGQKIIDYYSKQREVWADMALIVNDNSELWKKYADSGLPIGQADNLSIRQNERKLKPLQNLYRSIEKQLAVLEGREYVEPFNSPNPPNGARFINSK